MRLTLFSVQTARFKLPSWAKSSPSTGQHGFVLGLEACTDDASVALLDGDGHAYWVDLAGHASHARDFLPAVQAVLSAAQQNAADCRVVAADIGPGGFTGLRTACGLAQGLATGMAVPCSGRSSFETMAADLRQPMSEGEHSLRLDARLGQWYFASVNVHAQRGISLAGTPVLLDRLPGEEGPVHGPHALGVCVLALQDLVEGRLISPVHLQPAYVREKVADTTAERLAKRAQAKGV